MIAEFQAVVFAAGKGSRFPEVLENRPKCLLPIGPYPLIWYPLRMLHGHGFVDVIVIVQEHEKMEIQSKLERTSLKLKIDFCTVLDDSDVGTAEALRLIADRIKTDVLLVSCDVITDFSLCNVLKQFRQQDASVVSLLMHSAPSCTGPVPGVRMKHKSEKDLFAVCPQTNRLVFMGSESDFENGFELPGHLLRQHEKFDVLSGLVDAHIYVAKKWVIDILKTNPVLSTIKGELLPYIIKKQMCEQKSNLLQDASAKMNKNSETEPDTIKCFVTIAPNTSFGLRVNTLPSFYQANQHIYQVFETITNMPVSNLVMKTCDVRSTQMTQTTVGEQTTIQEKTSISKSTIGANCKIDSKVRLSDSTLMDNVVIEEGVIIENSIICDRSVVHSGSVLRNCLVGYNYVIPIGTKKENAHLSHLNNFMPI
uniref:Translation initiation factor eIF2B subunit gamma n=1 Tax=Culex tarsalis TaxID=7177 RepID=A0A1Q3G1K0_CULTA